MRIERFTRHSIPLRESYRSTASSRTHSSDMVCSWTSATTYGSLLPGWLSTRTLTSSAFWPTCPIKLLCDASRAALGKRDGAGWRSCSGESLDARNLMRDALDHRVV